jgi:hypothetical protein
MPDLVTHVALGHLIVRSWDLTAHKPVPSSLRLLFYLGILLPDILTRPWYILFPVIKNWTIALHTPMGIVPVCAIIALLFRPGLRRRGFLFLWAGTCAHFLLDTFQKHITDNNFWLFPFSWNHTGIGLAWADEFMDLLPLWIGLALAVELLVRIFSRKGKSSHSNSRRTEDPGPPDRLRQEQTGKQL